MTGIIGKIPSRSKIVLPHATVDQGGTGASTFTDGGVLLGSGVGAVTATAALADGEMLVGDGTTDPAIESGATLRTSIGLGNVDNVADASQVSVGALNSGSITSGFTSIDVGAGAIATTGAITGGTINGTEIVVTATNNLGIGTDAVDSISNGDYNVGVGDNALTAVSSGDNNTAMGYNALSTSSTTSGNSAFGTRALEDSAATVCSAFGKDALANNSSGNYNCAFGADALKVHTTGDRCCAFGFSAMVVSDDSLGTSAFGDFAGGLCTSGDYNTFIGYTAGYNVNTGSNNTFIGMDAGRASSPGGITTSEDNRICLGNTSVTVADVKVDWTINSDGRDKTDVEDFTAGLDFVNKMRSITYRWDMRSDYVDVENITPQDILDAVPDGTHKKPKQGIGFIAQDIEVLEKEIGFASSRLNQLFCSSSEDGTSIGLKSSSFIPLLVNAIQELSTKVTALENA